MNKLTDRIMDAIADGLSSKQCFVIFLIWSLLPAFVSPPHDFLTWNQYISQTIIQLVALSVLGYVSKKEGKEQRKIIIETHDMESDERTDMKRLIKEIHEHQRKGGTTIGL